MKPLTGQQVRRAEAPVCDSISVSSVGLPAPHTAFSAAVFIIPWALSAEAGGLALRTAERSLFACEMVTFPPLCHLVPCPGAAPC